MGSTRWLTTGALWRLVKRKKRRANNEATQCLPQSSNCSRVCCLATTLSRYCISWPTVWITFACRGKNSNTAPLCNSTTRWESWIQIGTLATFGRRCHSPCRALLSTSSILVGTVSLILKCSSSKKGRPLTFRSTSHDVSTMKWFGATLKKWLKCIHICRSQNCSRAVVLQSAFWRIGASMASLIRSQRFLMKINSIMGCRRTVFWTKMRSKGKHWVMRWRTPCSRSGTCASN